MFSPVCLICLILIRVVRVIKLHIFTLLFPYCGDRCDINVKCDVRFVFTPICFVGSSCYSYVSCIYLRMLVSNKISVSDAVHACLAVALLVSRVEQELLTIPEDMSSHAVFICRCFASVAAMLYQRKQNVE